MPEFLHLSPPIESLHILLNKIPSRQIKTEIVSTECSLGRILAADVRAQCALPEFSRSAVDGYAVKAQDTFGVSETLPGYLSIIGEVPMGVGPEISIKKGTAALIHTGGMLPAGADAVIMLEDTQAINDGEIHEAVGKIGDRLPELEITRAVAEGENVISIGEDVKKGELVIPAGSRIRSVEIGGCMALGIMKLRVVKKPVIGIISTGDEIVSPEVSTNPGQVRDINSYMLASLLENAGGESIKYGIVADNLESLKSTASRALVECDVLLITAGSSASSRDTTAEAISSLGSPGVLIHGVNVRPGKPTILAVSNGKPVIGLPGNPVSAFVICRLFVLPVLEKLLGIKSILPAPSVQASLTINLSSQAGREEWIAVKLVRMQKEGSKEDILGAEPIFGKSNLIFSLAKADGLIHIPANATGISTGEIVDVFLL